MHIVTRVFLIAGFVLTLGLQPSWGGAPPNNDPSDNQFNTAGGTNALQKNTPAPSTRLGGSTRSLATPPATTTLPAGSTRSISTPPATATQPLGSRRSLATPPATTTLPVGPSR